MEESHNLLEKIKQEIDRKEINENDFYMAVAQIGMIVVLPAYSLLPVYGTYNLYDYIKQKYAAEQRAPAEKIITDARKNKFK